MRPLLRSVVLALIVGCSLTIHGVVFAADRCFACHELLGDRASSLFKRDIHYQRGISCAGCHGGDNTADDMERAMDKTSGYIGVPKGDDISTACAKCHSDAGKMEQFHSSIPRNQLEKLQGSVHGKLSTAGNARLAQCTACHNAHGIVSVKDPSSPVHPRNVVKLCTSCHGNAAYMRSYNPSLPVDQLEKYRTSVHGIRNAHGDFKAAECASCHGSHDILPANDVKSSVYHANIPATCSKCHSNAAYMEQYKIPVDQFEKFSRSVHGVALLEKHDMGAPACNNCHGNHGAAPPGVESISKVCGTCHALNADLFSASPHKKGFDDLGLPECETCHENHQIIAATNELLGTSPEAVCSRCHSDTDSPEGFRVAGKMRRWSDSLDAATTAAQSLVDEAEQKGMEISELKFQMRDVRQARLEARTQVHSFNEEKFRSVVDKGFHTASMITTQGQQAIGEYYFRRIGLGIATLIITVLAVSLYLYIKRIERNQEQNAPGNS